MDLPMELLSATALFRHMEPEEIRRLLSCLGAARRTYGKGAFLFHQGEEVTACGIVLRGSVDAVCYHEDGTAELVARQSRGSVFGDVLMASEAPSHVTLRAAEETEVLYLPGEKLLGGCERACPCHAALRRNLLREMAEKYRQLQRRLRYLSEPSLRRRILLYLQAESPGGGAFTVPYGRQELADFLGVNRSALSRELGRLRNEGIIEFYKNSFRLL